jgi:hypothetical protein
VDDPKHHTFRQNPVSYAHNEPYNPEIGEMKLCMKLLSQATVPALSAVTEAFREENMSRSMNTTLIETSWRLILVREHRLLRYSICLAKKTYRCANRDFLWNRELCAAKAVLLIVREITASTG